MKIHLKIKEIVDNKGAEIIASNALIGMLDDEQVFDDIESVPYKKILRNIIKEGYAQKLLDIGAYTSDISFLASLYANKNLMQEPPILYVLDCLAYGLGWIDDEPTLQMSSSQENLNSDQNNRQSVETTQEIPKKKGLFNRLLGLWGLQRHSSRVKIPAKTADDYLQEAKTAKSINDIGTYFDSLKKAVDNGSAEACLLLGVDYYSGNGVVKDLCEAFKLFNKGASNGNEACALNMGFMYTDGEGVSASYKTALKIFEKFAKGGIGNPKAVYGMGYCYYRMLDTFKFEKTNESLNCYANAERWLLCSAKQGWSQGQFLIAELYLFYSYYYTQLSAKECHKNAHEWLLKASAQGHKGAEKELSRFKGAYWR